MVTESGSSAQDTLREDILAVGMDDFVSLAAVQGIIDEDGLADSAADCQRLVVDTCDRCSRRVWSKSAS
jgi:hypothetical protein